MLAFQKGLHRPCVEEEEKDMLLTETTKHLIRPSTRKELKVIAVVSQSEWTLKHLKTFLLLRVLRLLQKIPAKAPPFLQ